MSLEQVTSGMREAVGEDCGLGASVKWDFGAGQFLMLDASQVPNLISNDDSEADCTLKISLDDFIAMTQGELDGTSAFMSGRLKIEGDMGIAMKLQSVLKR